jgi:hypothetical protein
MGMDAKFIDAPFQFGQLAGARGRFFQYLVDIMRDLPDPVSDCRGIKAAGGREVHGSPQVLMGCSHRGFLRILFKQTTRTLDLAFWNDGL